MTQQTTLKLELVDVYKYEGFPQKRFRFRIAGTRIYLNVGAETIDEAVKKAQQIVDEMQLYKLVELMKSEAEQRK